MNITNFNSAPSPAAIDILSSPILWAGALGAIMTIIGIFINNFCTERQKINEFNRQRVAKKEDNSYEIRKEAYLDFCAEVTNFCASLFAMVDPHKSDDDLAFKIDLSSVGRVYMVASPKLVQETMSLVSDMQHAHLDLAARLTKTIRLRNEITRKYAIFDIRQEEIEGRLKTLMVSASEMGDISAGIQEFKENHADFTADAARGRGELEAKLYRTQFTSLETAALYVRQVETGLLSVLFYMRHDIGLEFDVSLMIESMKAEHARKTEKLEKLIQDIKF